MTHYATPWFPGGGAEHAPPLDLPLPSDWNSHVLGAFMGRPSTDRVGPAIFADYLQDHSLPGAEFLRAVAAPAFPFSQQSMRRRHDDLGLAGYSVMDVLQLPLYHYPAMRNPLSVGRSFNGPDGGIHWSLRHPHLTPSLPVSHVGTPLLMMGFSPVPDADHHTNWWRKFVPTPDEHPEVVSDWPQSEQDQLGHTLRAFFEAQRQGHYADDSEPTQYNHWAYFPQDQLMTDRAGLPSDFDAFVRSLTRVGTSPSRDDLLVLADFLQDHEISGASALRWSLNQPDDPNQTTLHRRHEARRHGYDNPIIGTSEWPAWTGGHFHEPRHGVSWLLRHPDVWDPRADEYTGVHDELEAHTQEPVGRSHRTIPIVRLAFDVPGSPSLERFLHLTHADPAVSSDWPEAHAEHLARTLRALRIPPAVYSDPDAPVNYAHPGYHELLNRIRSSDPYAINNDWVNWADYAAYQDDAATQYYTPPRLPHEVADLLWQFWDPDNLAQATGWTPHPYATLRGMLADALDEHGFKGGPTLRDWERMVVPIAGEGRFADRNWEPTYADVPVPGLHSPGGLWNAIEGFNEVIGPDQQVWSGTSHHLNQWEYDPRWVSFLVHGNREDPENGYFQGQVFSHLNQPRHDLGPQLASALGEYFNAPPGREEEFQRHLNWISHLRGLTPDEGALQRGDYAAHPTDGVSGPTAYADPDSLPNHLRNMLAQLWHPDHIETALGFGVDPRYPHTLGIRGPIADALEEHDLPGHRVLRTDAMVMPHNSEWQIGFPHRNPLPIPALQTLDHLLFHAMEASDAAVGFGVGDQHNNLWSSFDLLHGHVPSARTNDHQRFLRLQGTPSPSPWLSTAVAAHGAWPELPGGRADMPIHRVGPFLADWMKDEVDASFPNDLGVSHPPPEDDAQYQQFLQILERLRHANFRQPDQSWIRSGTYADDSEPTQYAQRPETILALLARRGQLRPDGPFSREHYLRALVNNPKHQAVHSAYADWLEANGMPAHAHLFRLASAQGRAGLNRKSRGDHEREQALADGSWDYTPFGTTVSHNPYSSELYVEHALPVPGRLGSRFSSFETAAIVPDADRRQLVHALLEEGALSPASHSIAIPGDGALIPGWRKDPLYPVPPSNDWERLPWELPPEQYAADGTPLYYTGPHEPFHPTKNPGGFSVHAPGSSIMGWVDPPSSTSQTTWPPQWAQTAGREFPQQAAGDLGYYFPSSPVDVYHLLPSPPDEHGISRWLPSNQGVQRRVPEYVARHLLEPQVEAAPQVHSFIGSHWNQFNMGNLSFAPLTPTELFRSGLVEAPPAAMHAVHDPDDWHSRMVFADWLDDHGIAWPWIDYKGRPVLLPGGGYDYDGVKQSAGDEERRVAQLVRARLGNKLSLPVVPVMPVMPADPNSREVQQAAQKRFWGYADDADPTLYGFHPDWTADHYADEEDPTCYTKPNWSLPNSGLPREVADLIWQLWQPQHAAEVSGFGNPLHGIRGVLADALDEHGLLGGKTLRTPRAMVVPFAGEWVPYPGWQPNHATLPVPAEHSTGEISILFQNLLGVTNPARWVRLGRMRPHHDDPRYVDMNMWFSEGGPYGFAPVTSGDLPWIRDLPRHEVGGHLFDTANETLTPRPGYTAAFDRFLNQLPQLRGLQPDTAAVQRGDYAAYSSDELTTHYAHPPWNTLPSHVTDMILTLWRPEYTSHRWGGDNPMTGGGGGLRAILADSLQELGIPGFNSLREHGRPIVTVSGGPETGYPLPGTPDAETVRRVRTRMNNAVVDARWAGPYPIVGTWNHVELGGGPFQMFASPEPGDHGFSGDGINFHVSRAWDVLHDWFRENFHPRADADPYPEARLRTITNSYSPVHLDTQRMSQGDYADVDDPIPYVGDTWTLGHWAQKQLDVAKEWAGQKAQSAADAFGISRVQQRKIAGVQPTTGNSYHPSWGFDQPEADPNQVSDLALPGGQMPAFEQEPEYQSLFDNWSNADTHSDKFAYAQALADHLSSQGASDLAAQWREQAQHHYDEVFGHDPKAVYPYAADGFPTQYSSPLVYPPHLQGMLAHLMQPVYASHRAGLDNPLHGPRGYLADALEELGIPGFRALREEGTPVVGDWWRVPGTIVPGQFDVTHLNQMVRHFGTAAHQSGLFAPERPHFVVWRTPTGPRSHPDLNVSLWTDWETPEEWQHSVPQTVPYWETLLRAHAILKARRPELADQIEAQLGGHANQSPFNVDEERVRSGNYAAYSGDEPTQYAGPRPEWVINQLPSHVQDMFHQLTLPDHRSLRLGGGMHADAPHTWGVRGVLADALQELDIPGFNALRKPGVPMMTWHGHLVPGLASETQANLLRGALANTLFDAGWYYNMQPRIRQDNIEPYHFNIFNGYMGDFDRVHVSEFFPHLIDNWRISAWPDLPDHDPFPEEQLHDAVDNLPVESDPLRADMFWINRGDYTRYSDLADDCPQQRRGNAKESHFSAYEGDEPTQYAFPLQPDQYPPDVVNMLHQLFTPEYSAHRHGHDNPRQGLRGILADAFDDHDIGGSSWLREAGLPITLNPRAGRQWTRRTVQTPSLNELQQAWPSSFRVTRDVYVPGYGIAPGEYDPRLRRRLQNQLSSHLNRWIREAALPHVGDVAPTLTFTGGPELLRTNLWHTLDLLGGDDEARYGPELTTTGFAPFEFPGLLAKHVRQHLTHPEAPEWLHPLLEDPAFDLLPSATVTRPDVDRWNQDVNRFHTTGEQYAAYEGDEPTDYARPPHPSRWPSHVTDMMRDLFSPAYTLHRHGYDDPLQGLRGMLADAFQEEGIPGARWLREPYLPIVSRSYGTHPVSHDPRYYPSAQFMRVGGWPFRSDEYAPGDIIAPGRIPLHSNPEEMLGVGWTVQDLYQEQNPNRDQPHLNVGWRFGASSGNDLALHRNLSVRSGAERLDGLPPWVSHWGEDPAPLLGPALTRRIKQVLNNLPGGEPVTHHPYFDVLSRMSVARPDQDRIEEQDHYADGSTPTQYAPPNITHPDVAAMHRQTIINPWEWSTHLVLADLHDDLGDHEEATFRRLLAQWFQERSYDDDTRVPGRAHRPFVDSAPEWAEGKLPFLNWFGAWNRDEHAEQLGLNPAAVAPSWLPIVSSSIGDPNRRRAAWHGHDNMIEGLRRAFSMEDAPGLNPPQFDYPANQLAIAEAHGRGDHNLAAAIQAHVRQMQQEQAAAHRAQYFEEPEGPVNYSQPRLPDHVQNMIKQLWHPRYRDLISWGSTADPRKDVRGPLADALEELGLPGSNWLRIPGLALTPDDSGFPFPGKLEPDLFNSIIESYHHKMQPHLLHGQWFPSIGVVGTGDPEYGATIPEVSTPDDEVRMYWNYRTGSWSMHRPYKDVLRSISDAHRERFSAVSALGDTNNLLPEDSPIFAHLEEMRNHPLPLSPDTRWLDFDKKN